MILDVKATTTTVMTLRSTTLSQQLPLQQTTSGYSCRSLVDDLLDASNDWIVG
jgi:hypothetical protein